jgi:hypothetical protein
LIDACEKVAAVSGGFLGIGPKVSAKEKEALRRVASAVGETHASAAARIEGQLKS